MLTVSRIEELQSRPEFLSAAELMFVALAHKQFVEKIVVKYQTEVLLQGQWCVRPAFCKGGDFGDRGFEANTVILSPDRAYLMAEDDHAVYLKKLEERRLASGLTISVEGHCPLLEAKATLAMAENHLMFVAEPYTGIPSGLMPQRKRSEYLTLLSKMAAAKVRQGPQIMAELLP